jgi:hypothetical protein
MIEFATPEARDAYARKCLACGVDESTICQHLGYKSEFFLDHEMHTIPFPFRSQTKLRIMTARLKARDAARRLKRGEIPRNVAKSCGYACVYNMNRAIKAYWPEYEKSPAPVGAGNGAEVNRQNHSTTDKEIKQ